MAFRLRVHLFYRKPSPQDVNEGFSGKITVNRKAIFVSLEGRMLDLEAEKKLNK